MIKTIFLMLLGLLITFSGSNPNELRDSGLWISPTKPTFKVLRSFDKPEFKWSAGHRGLDLFALPGQTVYAPVNGTISFVGKVNDREVLSLRLDSHRVLSFEPVVSELTEGEQVFAGMPLATLSTGGHCQANCLHIGLRIDDAYVDPISFFITRPVLLPLG